MSNGLRSAFMVILAVMIGVNVWASLNRSLFHDSAFFQDPWAVATLFDAYAGFLTFYLWVAYKEATVTSRALWFLAIMALGNIAMSSYMLIQLYKLRGRLTWQSLLLREGA